MVDEIIEKTKEEKLKDKIKEKVKCKDRLRPLSQQDFDKLNSKEKLALKNVVEAEGEDYDEYEKTMKSLFPTEVQMPPIHFRGH